MIIGMHTQLFHCIAVSHTYSNSIPGNLIKSLNIRKSTLCIQLLLSSKFILRYLKMGGKKELLNKGEWHLARTSSLKTE